MAIAMPIVMLEVIALVFERIDRLIFDPPPRSPASHNLIHRAFGHAEVGDPTEVLDLAMDGFPALQKVDPEVGIGCIEWYVTHKTKVLVHTSLRVLSIIRGDTSGLLRCRHLLEQEGMVTFFDTQNVMQVVLLEHLDMRGIGTEAIFGDDQFEMGVVLTQFD